MMLQEIASPLDLPGGERHVTCDGHAETLTEALAVIKSRYDARRLDLRRVYYSRSDGRWWFILARRG